MRMNAWQWYLDAWRNFDNFEGRSSRPAYWYFALVQLIISFMCLFVAAPFPVRPPGMALALAHLPYMPLRRELSCRSVGVDRRQAAAVRLSPNVTGAVGYEAAPTTVPVCCR